MADREFVFGHPEVQKLLREHFVLAAADDWYQRRRKDKVGRFFAQVADQSPRKGVDGATRQGRYVFTASGKLLGYNNNRDPKLLLSMLRESLVKWDQLPASDRRPGAVVVHDLPANALDREYTRIPPPDGIVLKVYSRLLEKDPASGLLVRAGQPGGNTDTFRHEGLGSAVDHLWIKPEELTPWLHKIKDRPRTMMPLRLAFRIARFHLVDNTRGEPPHWVRKDIRLIKLMGYYDPDNPTRVTIHGEFDVRIPTRDRGYAGELRGVIEFNPSTLQATRFDMVAVGEHWGEGQFNPGARSGRSPLGIAFTLADPSRPENRIPPQAIRRERSYWEADE